jgi:hypothetical protein
VAFVNDSEQGVKPIIRANPVDLKYRFKVTAGEDLNQSIASLNLRVSGCGALSEL